MGKAAELAGLISETDILRACVVALERSFCFHERRCAECGIAVPVPHTGVRSVPAGRAYSRGSIEQSCYLITA